MLDIDFSEFKEKITRFFLQPTKDSARIFHGRGGCFEQLEWLTVDWFNPVVWVVIYKPIEAEQLLALKSLLVELGERHPSIENILIQQRLRPDPVIESVYGDTPNSTYAIESGCQFTLNLTKNQNTGFFLDTQPARIWVKDNSANKRVLNLFAYTCAFSVMALKGGASTVVSMDMMKSAIATGKENHALNGVLSEKSVFYSHEIFRSLGKVKRHAPYDLVIVDPPSFQKEAFDVKKDYTKLLKKLAPLLSDDARLVLCLNAPYIDCASFKMLVSESLPGCKFIDRIQPRQDYCEVDIEAGVKMLIFENA